MPTRAPGREPALSRLCWNVMGRKDRRFSGDQKELLQPMLYERVALGTLKHPRYVQSSVAAYTIKLLLWLLLVIYFNKEIIKIINNFEFPKGSWALHVRKKFLHRDLGYKYEREYYWNDIHLRAVKHLFYALHISKGKMERENKLWR